MKFLDKPLTLEELESYYVESEYIGQIALIQNDGIKALAILDHRDDDGMCVVFAASGRYLREKDYGKTWWAFPYVENEIDREKWKAEWVWHSDDDGRTWLQCTACDYSLDSLEDEPKDFCPGCGRAMTLEAWAELEKRIRG